MANRRCFSASVVNTDRFLDLPLSAQALYFHLGMEMDDDGFAGGFRSVCAKTGATLDDVQALIDGGFIIVFKSKVVCDRYWTINNTLQNDRYKPTVYRKEKEMLAIATTADESRCKSIEYEIKPECLNNVLQSVSKVYTDCIQNVYRMDTECIQNVSKADTSCIQSVSKVDTKCIQNGNVTEHNTTEHNPTKLEPEKNHVDCIDNPSEEEKEEKIILSENPSLSSDEVERIKRFFNEFWYSYPTEGKQHRKKALIQFTRLNPYDGLMIKIINALSLWKEDLQQTREKVMLAETWLINQRWNDYC